MIIIIMIRDTSYLIFGYLYSILVSYSFFLLVTYRRYKIKIMIRYIMQWMKEEGYKFFLVFIFIIFLLVKLMPTLVETLDKPENTPKESSLKEKPQVTSSITIKPKEKPTDADLKVSQKYTATINGKTVEVPMSTPKETIKDSQVTVSQTIDVTAAVKPFIPRWSVGIGVGRYGSDTYIPLSITRHYKPAKRSLQFSIRYSTEKQKITGGEIQHLWNF